ncbi:unnamed protein product [Closterium sp. NIES-54]
MALPPVAIQLGLQMNSRWAAATDTEAMAAAAARPFLLPPAACPFCHAASLPPWPRCSMLSRPRLTVRQSHLLVHLPTLSARSSAPFLPSVCPPPSLRRLLVSTTPDLAAGAVALTSPWIGSLRFLGSCPPCTCPTCTCFDPPVLDSSLCFHPRPPPRICPTYCSTEHCCLASRQLRTHHPTPCCRPRRHPAAPGVLLTFAAAASTSPRIQLIPWLGSRPPYICHAGMESVSHKCNAEGEERSGGVQVQPGDCASAGVVHGRGVSVAL